MQTQDKGNTYGLDFLNGCGGLHSPRHVANMTITKENLNYKSSSRVTDSYSSYDSSSTRYSSSYTSSTPTSSPTVNGNVANGSKLITPTNITHQLSPSSFIVQRVERLYGPGALAQGFYARKNTTSSPRTTQKETTSQQVTSTVERNDDSSLPVLKLLRPEFRAQLTVASRKGRTSLPEPEKSSCPDEIKEMEDLRVRDEVDATAQKPSKINGEATRDGHRFLKLHSDEVAKLEALAEIAEKELSCCENEEACGVLRAAAGKARLLVAQKLNQFKGLCQKNIEQSSMDDFPTTNEDLAGFWDMVMIQVDEVVSTFGKIKKLKNNGWKPDVEKTDDSKGVPTKVTATTKKAAPKKMDPKAKEASRARDEARRKLIEERRKAMKEQANGQNNNDVIIV